MSKQGSSRLQKLLNLLESKLKSFGICICSSIVMMKAVEMHDETESLLRPS